MARKTVKELAQEIKEERIKMCNSILASIDFFRGGKINTILFTDDELKLIKNLVLSEKNQAEYLDEGL